MSTIAEKLTESKDGLSALLTYANSVTGQSDTTIGNAIKTLCDGFGGGGSAGVYMGEITPTTTYRNVTIPKLSPDVKNVIIYRADIAEIVTPENPATGNILGGITEMELTIRQSSSLIGKGHLRISANTRYTGWTITPVASTETVFNETDIEINGWSTSYPFLAGVKYKYIQW